MTVIPTGFNPDYSRDAPTPEQIGEMTGNSILEFGAPWCGHCQAAQILVQEVLADKPKLPHIKIYDGKGQALGRAFRIKLWPTLILLRDGKEVARVVRPAQAEEVRSLLRQSEPLK